MIRPLLSRSGSRVGRRPHLSTPSRRRGTTIPGCPQRQHPRRKSSRFSSAVKTAICLDSANFRRLFSYTSGGLYWPGTILDFLPFLPPHRSPSFAWPPPSGQGLVLPAHKTLRFSLHVKRQFAGIRQIAVVHFHTHPEDYTGCSTPQIFLLWPPSMRPEDVQRRRSGNFVSRTARSAICQDSANFDPLFSCRSEGLSWL